MPWKENKMENKRKTELSIWVNINRSNKQREITQKKNVDVQLELNIKDKKCCSNVWIAISAKRKSVVQLGLNSSCSFEWMTVVQSKEQQSTHWGCKSVVQLFEQQLFNWMNNKTHQKKICSIGMNNVCSIDWTTAVKLIEKQNYAKKKLSFNWIEQWILNRLNDNCSINWTTKQCQKKKVLFNWIE